MSPLLILYH